MPNTVLVIVAARLAEAKIFSKHLSRVGASLCRVPIFA